MLKKYFFQNVRRNVYSSSKEEEIKNNWSEKSWRVNKNALKIVLYLCGHGFVVDITQNYPSVHLLIDFFLNMVSINKIKSFGVVNPTK